MKRHLKPNVVKIVFGLLLMLPNLAFSQADNRPENVHIASPNSSSLGKVVDIPISYHTGIPNIEIPIYTIHEGPLTLPISLNYHAGGLKVMEQASWVGAGFSLSAGGMITRIVRGLPDEQLTAAPGGTDLASQPVSYFQNHGYYNYYIYNTTGAQQQGIGKNPDYQGFGNAQADGEADLFTFNFNGYSGKFYFRPDNTVVTAPMQDLVITPQFCPTGVTWCSQTSQNLSGWIVTTPDGTKYYFGLNSSSTADTGPIESTSTSLSGNWQAAKTISSWYLYKIQSADSQFSITLNYTIENYSFYSLSMTAHPGSGGSTDNTCYAPVKNVMAGARLYRIDFSTGTVNFNAGVVRQDLSDASIGFWDNDQVESTYTAARILDNIQISGTNLCQKFSFAYDYFYDPNPLTGNMALATFTGNNYHVHTDQKRLKLLSLTEKSCDGTIAKPPHIFTYDVTTPPPRTLSLAQDHWGYYNGATTNSGLIPTLSDDGGTTSLLSSQFNANRSSSWPAMRAGALMKIQYPTGGYTRFVYGSHSNIIVNQYSQGTPVTVGGLRIDSIIYDNGFDSKQNIRTFSYTDDYGVPSGVLFSKPTYISLIRNDVIHMLDGLYGGLSNDYVPLPGGCYDDDLNQGPSPRNGYFYSTATIFPMRTSQGNHFGYNQVRENELDGSYTIYKFTNYPSPTDAVATTVVNKAQCNMSVPNYPPAPLPFDFARGELINKSVYNAAGNKLKEISTTSVYTYQTIGVTGVIARLYSNTWLGTEYEILSGKKTKFTEDTFVYDATNPTVAPLHTTTVTNYASPNHSFPTSIVTTDASGGKVISDNRNTYIGDITIPACNVAQYFDGNLREDLTTLKAGFTAGLTPDLTPLQRYDHWQQYMVDINTKWTNYVANYLSYNNTYKTCMTGTSASWNWTTATPDLKALVILKNRNQINTIIENSHWLDGKFLSSSFLNYKDFAGDGVGIYPVKYEVVMPNVPLVSTAFTPVTVNSGGTALVKDSKYIQEATYVYKSNQPVEVTGKDGVTTSYIWGFSNNLPFVQAVGVNYATLLAAYNAVSGNLTTLRSQSSLSNAQITTYSYDPLVGMTSQTDPNGVTTTYKYDVIGRLLYITDQNSKILKQFSYKYSNLNNH